MRDAINKLNQRDAARKELEERQAADRRWAKIEAATEKDRKERAERNCLVGWWIDNCCTVQHPMEGPEIIVMLVCNGLLVGAAIFIVGTSLGALLAFCQGSARFLSTHLGNLVY